MTNDQNDSSSISDLLTALVEVARAIRNPILTGLQTAEALSDADREALSFALERAAANLEWSADYVTRISNHHEST